MYFKYINLINLKMNKHLWSTRDEKEMCIKLSDPPYHNAHFGLFTTCMNISTGVRLKDVGCRNNGKGYTKTHCHCSFCDFCVQKKSHKCHWKKYWCLQLVPTVNY